jgi:CSLREA domain-containing protein
MRKAFFYIAALTLVFTSAFGTGATPAHAETIYTVGSLADAPADGNCATPATCTLRDAIALANTNPGFDTITITAQGTITLTEGQFFISESVQISGPGNNLLTIDAGNTSRIFNISQSSAGVNLNGMKLMNGNALGTNVGEGGAIYSEGSLTMNELWITNNTAEYYGGGIFINSAGANYLSGTNLLISENSAENGGGIAMSSNGDLFLQGVSIRGNIASDGASNGLGGGIYIANAGVGTSTPTIDFSYIGNNTAANGGGGIFLADNALLLVKRSTVAYNEAKRYGGGIYVNSASGSSATIQVYNSTISTNLLEDSAAGASGAGMYVRGHADLRNATIMDNDATNGGSDPSYGGAIYFYNDGNNRTFHVKNPVIANNIASDHPICGGEGFTSVSYSLLEEEGCGATNGVDGNIVGLDPLTNPLAANDFLWSDLLTHSLTLESPALDAGSNGSCLLDDQYGYARPQDGNGDGVFTCDMGAYERISLRVFRSSGSQDGWILESGETTNKGGKLNKGASTLNIGDDSANRQYRAILSFNTSAIPSGSDIRTMRLALKRQGVTGGGNPINTFKGFMVDIKKGNFGTAGLQLADFSTKASKTYGAFKPTLNTGWYSINLNNGRNYLNTNGNTQLRLRFKLDDNNNSAANFMKIYSGNAGSNAPQLIVEYYAP